MRRFWIILLFLVTALLALTCINWVAWQHHAVRDFIPVPARITDAHVQVTRGKSTTYAPRATYTYLYQNKSHQASRIHPVDDSETSTLAYEEVDRLKSLMDQSNRAPEARAYNTTAYIDPDNPDDSVLVRDYSFTPYFLSMLTFMGAVFALWLWFGMIAGGRKNMTAIALDDSGWQLLLPVQSLRKSVWNAVAWCVGTFAATAPLFFHWFFIARQRNTGLVWIFPFAALWIFLLIIALRRWILSRHISDTRLRVRPVPLKRGDPFALEVEADARAPLALKQLLAHIVCIEHYRERHGNKTQLGTRTKGIHTLQLAAQTTIPADALLAGKGDLLIPAAELPATSSNTKTYPYYTWEIRIFAELTGMVDYTGVFPLTVQ